MVCLGHAWNRSWLFMPSSHDGSKGQTCPTKEKELQQGKTPGHQQKTQKLLSVGHTREIQYLEWLANMVLVKKANGKLRMCVDFTNLNKAYPKDSYPLPNMDYQLLSFLDAFLLIKSDQELRRIQIQGVWWKVGVATVCGWHQGRLKSDPLFCWI